MRLNALAVLKWMCAAVAAWWIHDVPLALHTLAVLMLIDYGTGLVAALMEGKISSSVGWRGLVKKTAIIGFLMLGHWVEKQIGHEIGAEMFGAFGYGVNEGVSIIENFARLGVPLPDRAIDMLAAIRKLWGVRRPTPEQLARLRGCALVDESRRHETGYPSADSDW